MNVNPRWDLHNQLFGQTIFSSQSRTPCLWCCCALSPIKVCSVNVRWHCQEKWCFPFIFHEQNTLIQFQSYTAITELRPDLWNLFKVFFHISVVKCPLASLVLTVPVPITAMCERKESLSPPRVMDSNWTR